MGTNLKPRRKSMARAIVADLLVRNLFPILALAGIWGALLWGPWASCAGALSAFFLMRVLEARFGPAKPLPEERTGRTTRILAHPEDIHVVVFMSLYAMGIASAALVYLTEVEPMWDKASTLAYCASAAIWLGWSGGIHTGINYHSHIHRGVFKNKALNRWVGRLWTIPGGFPACFWSYKHLEIHHRFVHTSTDWVQPRRMEDGRYENLYLYSVAHWPWRWWRHFIQDMAAAPAPIQRKAAAEVSFFLTIWSIPSFLDPVFGFGIWLGHQWVGNVVLMGPGMYAQHAFCSNQKRFAHSNTYLCAFFNKAFFNAGFHIEHTEHPGVHWSELPALHNSIRSSLAEHGARVRPYGAFTGAGLLSGIFASRNGYDKFLETDSERILG